MSERQDPMEWAVLPWFGGERVPDSSCHQSADAVVALTPDLTLQERPTLAGIVVRNVDGSRAQPMSVAVTPGGGIDGDRWATGTRKLTEQVSMMNVSVAHQIANGQSVVYSGDNLFVDLDISAENLPAGTRLLIGDALFEVSAETHTPCHLFKSRFGDAAFRRAATVDRVRGAYLTVPTPGEIRAGDEIVILRSED